MAEIRNGSRLYEVGNRVGETSNYRLYLCTQDVTKRQCLLQIATGIEQNGGLIRIAYILGELKRHADELEEEYAKVKTDPEVMLNYDFGFPEALDGFICQEQGGRRINILAFRNVEDTSRWVPLSNITDKDRLRVDLRTSAWIMGKLLKLLVFAHSEGISIGRLTGNNILIEPDQHYVLIFDWSEARTHPEVISKKLRCQDISQAAQSIIAVLGGDLEAGIVLDDREETLRKYTDYLLRLARGKSGDTSSIHEEFYKLIDKLWERKYHPFTTKPLNAEKIEIKKEE